MREKHVIFLGAGASVSSGYPAANELRLRMSSSTHFAKAIKEAIRLTDGVPDEVTCLEHALEYFSSFQNVISLFREGGFSTLDEFCKLAGGGSYQAHIDRLRVLLRACLSLHNPEDNFEASDYYPFIQSLFNRDLFGLRDDLAVLSFNYDPYLDYLLLRALRQRYQVRELAPVINLMNSVTGGFCDEKQLDWLTSDNGKPTFCLLKLHGSICRPEGGAFNGNHIFMPVVGSRSRAAEERIRTVCDPQLDPALGLVLFPWEIIDDQGSFVEEDGFVLGKGALYKLFKGVWARAKREVEGASKISFVGLSMHPYLEFGFRYLFSGKSGPVEVVVANVENERHQSTLAKNPLHSVTPCGKTYNLLERVSDGQLMCVRSGFDTDEVISPSQDVFEGAEGPSVTARFSFRDFIEREMYPPTTATAMTGRDPISLRRATREQTATDARTAS